MIWASPGLLQINISVMYYWLFAKLFGQFCCISLFVVSLVQKTEPLIRSTDSYDLTWSSKKRRSWTEGDHFRSVSADEVFTDRLLCLGPSFSAVVSVIVLKLSVVLVDESGHTSCPEPPNQLISLHHLINFRLPVIQSCNLTHPL